MAKKEKLKLDEFNIDNDLDFDSFDIGDIESNLSPEAKNPKKRTPVMDVFRGTIGGIKTTASDPRFVAELTKKSLPSTYGEVFSAADEVAGTATALYDEAVKELKPQISLIAKKIDRLVPDEQKFLKKATGKLANFFGADEQIKGPSKEEIQNQSIQTSLAQVFEQKHELDQQAEARQNAEQKIKDHTDTKRFESNFGLLNSINEGMTRLSNYTERVNQAFQKKSLELQYRSYFVQSELLQATQKYFEVFKNQNEAIAKNTALPEFVKINNSERFKDIARNKFFTSVQESLFGQDSWFGNFAKKLKADGKQYIAGIKQGLEGAMAGVDTIEEIRNLNQSLVAAGGTPITGAELAGNALGGGIANKASDLIADKAKPWLEKRPGVVQFGNKLSTFALNAGGVLDDWRNTDKFQENLEKDGLTGKAYRFADAVINYGQTTKPDMQVDNPAGIKGLQLGDVFNGRTQRSIVEIIPGYLSRILREITVIRTGDENSASVLFDHTSGKFVDKKEVGSSIKKTLSDKISTSGYSFRLDRASKDFLKDREVSEDQKAKVNDFFSRISAIPDMNYTPENIMKTRVFASLDKETQDLIREQFEMDAGDELASSTTLNNMTRNVMNVRKATPDVRGEIEQFIKLGYGEILEEQGLVKRDKNGNYHIVEKAYFDLLNESTVTSDRNAKRGIRSLSPKKILDGIRSKSTSLVDGAKNSSLAQKFKNRTLVKSDVLAKEGISSMEPSSALDAIKNTRVYKWFYKQGQGDDRERTGPMAQDVNRTMGEDAAPGGKQIDLTTMNGNNMAAIQALAERQERMIESEQSATILKDIKQDTLEIVKLLSQSGSGLGVRPSVMSTTAQEGGDYKSLFTTIFSSAATVMTKASGDLFKASKDVFNFTKDKLVKPGAKGMRGIYDKVKDPVGSAFKTLLTKAGEMASKALDVGQDIVFNKLPAGLREAAMFGNKVKDKLKEWFNGARDVYVQGRESPVLQATLMKAGYYRDQVTGKVLKTMDDLKDLKGNIIGPAGNVILTIEEAAEGLYDQYGQKIKGIFGKLASAAAGMAMAGFARAKKFWQEAIPKGKGLLGKAKGLFSSAKDKISEKLDGASIGGHFSFGTDKIYDVLVEIRDLMRGEDPPKHETKKDFKKFFVGPMPEKELSKRATQAVNLAKKTKDTLTDKAKGLFSGIKSKFTGSQPGGDFVGPPSPTTVTEEVTTGAEQPQADTSPRYQSGGNAVDMIFSAGSKLKSMIPGAIGKLGDAKDAFKGGKGIKGKALAVAGSLFKSKPGADSGEAPKAEEKPAETKPQSLTDKAKDLFTQAKDKVKTVTKTITGQPKGQAAFNDTDGSGRRDGDWRDRIEQMEKRKKDNKKDPLQADLQARYKSDQNIIDTIMEKASGLFDLAKGGLGSILGSAGDLMSGGKGMLGKLGGGLKSFAKSPVKTTLGAIKGAAGKGMGALRAVGTPLAKGLGAAGKVGAVSRVLSAGRLLQGAAVVGSFMTGGIGSAVLAAGATAMSALGAIVSSPVVLGALAVGAVGYGAYKLYKYATRNNLNDLDAIRLAQYGLSGKSGDQYNAPVLKLEDYLSDGRIGYDNGRAYILEKKLDKEELLSIFDIDKNDDETVSRFNKWFGDRFKPFFLTHLTSLFSINNKAKISGVGELKPEEKVKYLKLTEFPGGPHNVLESPFKEVPSLQNNQAAIKTMTEALISKYSNTKNKKDGKSSIQDQATKAAAVQAAADKAAQQKATVAPTIKEPAKDALPKTNVAVDKNKSMEGTPFEDTGEGDGPVKDGIKTPSMEASGKAGNQKVVQAAGPLRDGEGGRQYLVLQDGVKLDNVNPEVLKNFMAMVQEYGETTGKKVVVTSAGRTMQDQEALYRKNPKLAAKPGKSLHEFGLALDANSKDLDALDEMGLMRKYGFTRPVGGEPWHTEPAGIQVNIDKAKKDPDFAEQAVQASLFKGGGGVGSDRSLPKTLTGKRDPAMALSLLEGASVQMAKAPTDKDKAVALTSLSKPDTKAAAPGAAAGAPETGTKTQMASKPANDPKMSDKPENKTQVASSTSTAAKPAVGPVSQQVAQSEKYSKIDSLPDIEEKPKEKTLASSSDLPKDPRDKKEVRKSVEKIAQKANAEPEMLSAFAAVESSLNPFAKASTSSASGLFQFTKATWDEQMMKNARKYDLDPSTSPTDVKAATLMASEYIKSNKKAIQSVKPDPTLTDIYLTHFLGAGGARKLLSADPNEVAAKILPAAAKSNQAIFYDKGFPLTVAEVYNRIDRKLTKTAKDFGIDIESGEMPTVKSADKAGGEGMRAGSTGSGATTSPTLASSTTSAEAALTKTSLTSATGSGKTMVSADAGTTSTQLATTPERSKSVFTPQQPTVLASNELNTGMRGMATGTSDFSGMSTILDKQLDVQEQMLEVLKVISEKVDPEQFKGIAEAIGGMSKPSSPEPARKPSSPMTMTSVKSAVDLGRKVA